MKIYKIIMLFAVLLLLYGCAKYRLNRETITSEDNAASEIIFNDVFRLVDEQVKLHGNQLGRAGGGSCPQVSIQNYNGGYPKTLNIAYGEQGCIDDYDVERRGAIQAVFQGPYYDAGSVVEVTLMDFYRNNTRAEGTLRITNEGMSIDGNLVFKVEVMDGRVVTIAGEELQWESQRYFEWIEGSGEPIYIYDDVYKVTGYGSGVNRDGRYYTFEITVECDFLLGCPVYRSGKQEIKPENLNTRIVDYGEGFCDNLISVDLGRKTKSLMVR